MPAWKVLFIGLFACVCFGFAIATALAPINIDGGQRWAWMGGLLVVTLGLSTLFAYYLRHASKFLDVRTRGTRG